MTPRAVINSASIANSLDPPASEDPVSDDEADHEPRPTHTSEIGTLKKLPNHNTAWLGSSSGVYFVNTVRRAFSATFAASKDETAIPDSEDILTGDDVDGRSYNGPIGENQDLEDHAYRHLIAAVGRPPPERRVAMDLITSFFRCWHPLFPFLHGPQFLKDVDDIYSSKTSWSIMSRPKADETATKTFATPQRSCSEYRKFITFQIVINIASLDRPDIPLPKESRIKSSWIVTQIAGAIAVRHDMDTIQACLAAELFLVATICLRQASTVAGIILKLIYHAGLHRCPLRYAQLSLEDCEIRKRIFWSAYALDRYLSLSLGDPNTVQDSDIDVCLSGKELHKAVARDLVIHPADEIKLHLPAGTPGAAPNDSPSEDPRVFSMNNGPHAREKQLREAAMTAYVHYGRLTGRIIEIFHKSIHARFPKQDAILYLDSDIDSWWNGLPSSLTGEDGESSAEGEGAHHRQLAPFFTILSQQLQLLLKRPRLSLDQSTAEFQNGLAVCIKASRTSITALKKHKENGQSMLLPGLLSATWMAGLIIAFACQLGKLPKARALSDISACLRLLESMGSRKWFTVKNCHKVLSLLLENINARKASANGFLATTSRSDSATPTNCELSQNNTATSESASTTRKRPLYADDDTVSGPSPKREGSTMSESSPAGLDFRLPLHPASSTGYSAVRGVIRENSDPTPGLWSRNTPSSSSSDLTRRLSPNVTPGVGSSASILADNASPPSRSAFLSAVNNQQSSSGGTHETTSPPPMYASKHQVVAPTSRSRNSAHMNEPTFNMSTNAAVSTNSAVPTNLSDDPMFWANFDMNMSDIFSAASWENMTGSGGPMNMTFGGMDTGFGGLGGVVDGFMGDTLQFTARAGTTGIGNEFEGDVLSGDNSGGGPPTWNEFAFTAGGDGLNVGSSSGGRTHTSSRNAVRKKASSISKTR